MKKLLFSIFTFLAFANGFAQIAFALQVHAVAAAVALVVDEQRAPQP